MNQSPERALAGLADALSVLAQTLYEAEASPDLVFVRAQAEAAGVSSPAATRVVGLLAALWEQYPLAKDVVERLGEAVAAGRHDEVAQLLGPDAVQLPDGTTRFVGALIDDLQARRRGGREGWGSPGGGRPGRPGPPRRGRDEGARTVGPGGADRCGRRRGDGCRDRRPGPGHGGPGRRSHRCRTHRGRGPGRDRGRHAGADPRASTTGASRRRWRRPGPTSSTCGA